MKASHAKVASLPTRDDDVAPGSSVRSEGAEEMSGEKIAARTERTTRKPRMGHAMATAGRGPRLLRRGVCCLSVVLWRQAGPRGVLCCVAPQRFLRQLGDGDEAMSHEYILDKMSTVENVYKARWLLIAQMLVLSSPCCLIS